MKKLLLLFSFILSLFSLGAESVDVQTAQTIAENFAYQAQKNIKNLRSTNPVSVSLVYTFVEQPVSGLRNQTSEKADVYVFNIGRENGFVIVSGDDRVRPVIAYATEGSFVAEQMPENLASWMKHYQDEIRHAVTTQWEATDLIKEEWNKYLTGTFRSTQKVLLQTANWDQQEPYNRMCPQLPQGIPPTGCVATAMGIVMKYYNYPLQAIHGVSAYGGVSITYDKYDWNNMLMEYKDGNYTDEQARAVAKLLFHCGANVKMQYEINESVAYMTDIAPALMNTFGYSKQIRYINKNYNNYSWNEWITLLKKELDAQRPVIYSGKSISAAHAFICDGYNSDETYHINWGWGGTSNGNYLLTVLDPSGKGDGYIADPCMLVGIEPDKGADTGYSLRMIRSLAAVNAGGDQTRFDVFFTNEGNTMFKGYLNLAVWKDGKIKKILNEKNYPVELKPNYSYKNNPCMLYVTLKDPLSATDRIVVVYSEQGTSWEVLKGGEGVNWQVDMNHQTDPDVDICIDLVKSDFKDYYGIGEVQNEGMMVFATSNGREICFCYKLKDPSWRTSWDVSYKAYDDYFTHEYANSKPLVFDASGEAWSDVVFMPDCYGFPKLELYNKLYFKSSKAGLVNYEVLIYNKERTTLLGRFDPPTLIFIEPVHLFVSPIKGVIDEKVPFTVTIKEEVNEILKGKKIGMKLRFIGEILSNHFLPNVNYIHNGNSEKMLLYEENYAASANGKSWVAELPHYTYLGLDTYSFDFTFSGTLKGLLTVELYTIKNVGIQTVIDRAISIDNPFAAIDISTSEDITYGITTYLTHITSKLPAKIGHKQPLSFQLVPDDTYALPSTIRIRMGGSELVSGTHYTYNQKTGDVRIEAVTGDIEITAEALSSDKKIKVVDNEDAVIGDGTSVVSLEGLEIKGKTGENRLHVTLNQVRVESSTGGKAATSVARDTKTLLILQGTNVLGSFTNNGNTILQAAPNATPLLQQTTVVNNGVLTDETGLLKVVDSSKAPLNIKGVSNQEILKGQTAILVASTSEGTAESVSFVWQKWVKGNWVDIPATFHSASFLSDAAEIENRLEVSPEENTDYRCLVTNSVQEVSTTLTLYSSVTVKSEDPSFVYYTITLPVVEGASTVPGAGKYLVTEGSDFSFTLFLDTDYNQSEPVVAANGTIILPLSNGSYLLSNVKADQPIQITGLVKNKPVDIEKVKEEKYRVHTRKGILYLYTPQKETVHIFTFNGQLYKTMLVRGGENRIPLSPGCYLIVIEKKVFKITL